RSALSPVERHGLPPVLAGHDSADIQARLAAFYSSVAQIFERWVSRRQSPHTRRAYRQDVMAFVQFMGWSWPEESSALLTATIADVTDFRDHLAASGAAPKTLNRRVSSLSSFYKYLAGAAAELRLPVNLPNPAHAQFIARESADPREERRALSAARAR